MCISEYKYEMHKGINHMVVAHMKCLFGRFLTIDWKIVTMDIATWRQQSY